MFTSDSLIDLLPDRVCSDILPSIDQKIEWLHLESRSMERKFTFNISSLSSFYNEINLPSNEDIQKTFEDFNSKQIIYFADYFSEEKKGYCHIYSYPYKLNYYNQITNNFLGGIFKYVPKVELFDERPFKHEFFLRISLSFPIMEELTVHNEKQQINKPFPKSLNILILKNLIFMILA